MNQLKGADGFDCFYGNLFQDRWQDLKTALLKPVCHVARINGFADPGMISELNPDRNPFDTQAAVLSRGGEKSFGFPVSMSYSGEFAVSPPVDSNGLKAYYLMDPASILPVRNLNIEPGHQVADCCAAPGGKTLVMAEFLKESGFIVANDRSRTRNSQLRRVLREYLPDRIRRNIKVTSYDAEKWCLYERDRYDRILLDAPCSSERHLLRKPSLLESWTPARSRQLSRRQYTMLVSAYRMLKPGGMIVYSTCALSPLENQAVVERLIKKFSPKVALLPIHETVGESQENGWQILPDLTSYGPIYFSVIQRLS